MEYKISAIKQSDLDIKDESRYKMIGVLYDLASYKKDERGWSFFVKKDYLSDFIVEVENDKNQTISDYEISFLKSLLLIFGDNELLLIDNDNLL
jgi:hypothetical protein